MIKFFENLKSFGYTPSTRDIISTPAPAKSDVFNVYICIDCPGEGAFAHWVLECLPMYKLYKEILSKFPKAKFATTISKRFVKDFLEFMGFENVEVINTRNVELPNRVFFPYVACLSKPMPDIQIYKPYLQEFCDFVDMVDPNPTRVNILFMVRSRVESENFAGNKRTIRYDGLEDEVLKRGGKVVDSWDIPSIRAQVALVKSADVLIVDFGSSFFVNGIFAKNSHIVAIDGFGWAESQLRGNLNAYRTLGDLIFARNRKVDILANDKLAILNTVDAACALV